MQKNNKNKFSYREASPKKVKQAPKKANNDYETLIIVDKQFDFDNPDGALYVKGGENTNKAIIEYVKKNKGKVNQIIYTKDMHKANDQSFKDNGGEWPVHCVEGTNGSNINYELYTELSKLSIPTVIFNKGTNPKHEEYGAFEKCSEYHYLYPNIKPIVKNVYFKNYDGTSGCVIHNENVVICGIAGDYCVNETIKNLLKYWKKFNIKVLMSGIVSIDDGFTLEETIEKYNLTKV